MESTPQAFQFEYAEVRVGVVISEFKGIGPEDSRPHRLIKVEVYAGNKEEWWFFKYGTAMVNVQRMQDGTLNFPQHFKDMLWRSLLTQSVELTSPEAAGFIERVVTSVVDVVNQRSSHD